MTNAQHTPAPWRYEKDEFGNFSIGGHTMTGMGGNVDNIETAEANARLIAAAPLMLHFLKYQHDTLKRIYSNYKNCGDYAIAENIIKQAEGRA